MTDRKIRVGVIGLGKGADHAAAYGKNPEAELVALCDKDPSWLQRMRGQHSVRHEYSDYRPMLEQADIDAVSVCLPNHLHAPVTIECLRAGKHVLCEKPMALNGEEAQAMADAAENADRFLMVSQNQRFSREAQYLKRCIEEDRFGAIYYVKTAWRRTMGQFPSQRRASRTRDRNWLNQQQKGGVLRDLGSHLLDRALWLLDFPEIDQVVAANCCIFTPALAARFAQTADAEDFAAGMIRFKNGAALELEVSFGGFIEKSQNYLEVNGTLGGALLTKGELKITARRRGEYVTTIAENLPGVQSVQDHFVHAIRHGAQPQVTAEQGVRVIRVLDALYAAGTSHHFSSPVLADDD